MNIIPFQTTTEQILKLPQIIINMKQAGHPDDFLAKVLKLAVKDQGIFDLVELWDTASTNQEADEIITDIKKSINDYNVSISDCKYVQYVQECDDIYTLKEFEECCRRGSFTDYDGFGSYSDGKKIYDTYISPSDFETNSVDRTFSHVVWYNK